MKILGFKSVRMFALAAVMAPGAISCGSDDSITRGSDSIANAERTPAAKVQEIPRSDGGRTFVLADGWPIPSFGEAQRKAFETSIMTSDGRSVKVQLTVIETDPLSLYTENPFYEIDVGV